MRLYAVVLDHWSDARSVCVLIKQVPTNVRGMLFIFLVCATLILVNADNAGNSKQGTDSSTSLLI